MSFFYSNQNYQFGQFPIVLDEASLANPSTNDLQKGLVLFQPSHIVEVGKIATLQQAKTNSPSQDSSFNLSSSSYFRAGAFLVLLALGFSCFLIFKVIRKQSVPETDVLEHHDEFEKIIYIAKQVERADSEKFTGREFITYLKAKIQITHSKDNGIYKSINLLKVMISSKRQFDQIFMVETQYLGRNQQEFYGFVDDLVQHEVFGEDFRQQIGDKLPSTLTSTLSEEGKKALEVYANALGELSHHEYALKMLAQFKKYEMSGYVLIRTINDLLTKFVHINLDDSKVVLPDIEANFDLLEKLAPIIEMPKTSVNPEGFAKVFHFTALEVKQQDTYQRFKRLLTVLETWRPIYKKLQDIRQLYSPKEYRLPKEFCLKIPGESIFEKHINFVPQILDSPLYLEFVYSERNDFGLVSFF